jgi:hypothetical protein
MPPCVVVWGGEIPSCLWWPLNKPGPLKTTTGPKTPPSVRLRDLSISSLSIYMTRYPPANIKQTTDYVRA